MRNKIYKELVKDAERARVIVLALALQDALPADLPLSPSAPFVLNGQLPSHSCYGFTMRGEGILFQWLHSAVEAYVVVDYVLMNSGLHKVRPYSKCQVMCLGFLLAARGGVLDKQFFFLFFFGQNHEAHNKCKSDWGWRSSFVLRLCFS